MGKCLFEQVEIKRRGIVIEGQCDMVMADKNGRGRAPGAEVGRRPSPMKS